MSDSDEAKGAQAHEGAARQAIAALLAPLARLAISQGVTVVELEELLRQALVQEARQVLISAGQPEHRLVSRISTTTGLTRREVNRLLGPTDQAPPAMGGSLAAEVFTRWVTDRSLRSARGEVLPLQRQGAAPSFEALARSVTQDVHPRSLLEELCRLGMAQVDDAADTVRLLRDAYVPNQDKQHMLGFLADNVGDHLCGAVDNVLGHGARQHFDQAVFADELSAESVQGLRQFISSQWQNLLQEAVPLLEQGIEADRLAGRAQCKRVRIGLYSYEDDMKPVRPAPPAQALPPSTKQSRKRTGDD